MLAQESPDFSPRGNAAGKLDPTILGGLGAYDPRPTGSGIGQGVQPRSVGLDRAGTYRGAFEPGVAELWTTPWTAGNIGGVVED